jgi:hypothetical protein
MHFFIVFIATTIALFWDEALITIIGVLTQRKFSSRFLMYWVLCSGSLAVLLIGLHVPAEYRAITIVMIGLAVLFNLDNQTSQKDDKKIIPVM